MISILSDYNMPVFRSSMALKEAMKLRGLVSLETESYPELVSVISVGMPIHSIAKTDSSGTTMIQNRKQHRISSQLIICFPTSEGCEMSKQASKRVSAAEGASEASSPK